MNVVLSDQARASLREIAHFIARDNRARARSFARALRAKALEIGAMPRAFPLVPRYERLGVRRRVYRDYLIFYCVEGDRVVIIHILHGVVDYEPLLFPEA
jgi:plasmid stabilization system protein ParE